MLQERNEYEVTFWNGDDVQAVPLSIFMNILYIGEESIKEYENKYDLSKENNTTAGVRKLKNTVDFLRVKLQSVCTLETPEKYREKVDREHDSAISKDHLVESLCEGRGAHTWSAGRPSTSDDRPETGRKGLSGVASTMPELQKLYEDAASRKKPKWKRTASCIEKKTVLEQLKSIKIKRCFTCA